MKNKPLISVIMGTYYRRDETTLIKRSIQSILDQSYANFEFLICDDGSTPEAIKVVDSFAEKDSRVRPIRPGRKYHLAEKLNACLAQAKGEFIARMDDDDHSHPERFEKQMDYLMTHRETSFVGCVAGLERDGEIIGLRRLPENPIVRDFYFAMPFLHPTLIFRKQALEQINGYSEHPRCVGCEDYDLLLRLYGKGLVGSNIQVPLFTYTLSSLSSEKRGMLLRWNEVKTRYVRFRALRRLPEALPYVIKPIIVGLLPRQLLEHLKANIRRRGDVYEQY